MRAVVFALTGTPSVPQVIAPVESKCCTRQLSGLVEYQGMYAPPEPSGMKSGKLPVWTEPVTNAGLPKAPPQP